MKTNNNSDYDPLPGSLLCEQGAATTASKVRCSTSISSNLLTQRVVFLS